MIFNGTGEGNGDLKKKNAREGAKNAEDKDGDLRKKQRKQKKKKKCFSKWSLDM